MPSPNRLMSFQGPSTSSILVALINQLPHIESKAYPVLDQ